MPQENEFYQQPMKGMKQDDGMEKKRGEPLRYRGQVNLRHNADIFAEMRGSQPHEEPEVVCAGRGKQISMCKGPEVGMTQRTIMSQ